MPVLKAEVFIHPKDAEITRLLRAQSDRVRRHAMWAAFWAAAFWIMAVVHFAPLIGDWLDRIGGGR